MERDVIFAEDVEKIFGKRPWTSRSEEIFGNGNNSEAAEVVDAQQENQENTTEAADTVTA
jgi:cell division protease FtsH